MLLMKAWMETRWRLLILSAYLLIGLGLRTCVQAARGLLSEIGRSG